MRNWTLLAGIVFAGLSCAHAPMTEPVEPQVVEPVEEPMEEPVLEPAEEPVEERAEPERPVLDRERYPLDCDDGNALTSDDTIIDGLCVGLVDPDQDGAPNTGTGPPCLGPDDPQWCVDNCRLVPNPDQADEDGDGVGDACEEVVEWTHVDATEKVVALTFDDGYNDAILNSILDTLEAYNARGTFFLNALYITNRTLKKKTLKRLRDGGHLSGNHTVGHKLGDDEAQTRAQIADCESLFEKAAGIGLRPWFRSPSYADNAWRDEILLELGYTVNLLASVDLEDWTNPPPPADGMARCVDERVEPGDIILFHVGPKTTPKALPAILDALEQQGYEFVTTEELLYFGDPVRAPNSKNCRQYYR